MTSLFQFIGMWLLAWVTISALTEYAESALLIIYGRERDEYTQKLLTGADVGLSFVVTCLLWKLGVL